MFYLALALSYAIGIIVFTSLYIYTNDNTLMEKISFAIMIVTAPASCLVFIMMLIAALIFGIIHLIASAIAPTWEYIFDFLTLLWSK